MNIRSEEPEINVNGYVVGFLREYKPCLDGSIEDDFAFDICIWDEDKGWWTDLSLYHPDFQKEITEGVELWMSKNIPSLA